VINLLTVAKVGGVGWICQRSQTSLTTGCGECHQVLGVPVTLTAAGVCFGIRMVGLHFDLDAPKPPGAEGQGSAAVRGDGG
jgi:hypothetical protein